MVIEFGDLFSELEKKFLNKNENIANEQNFLILVGKCLWELNCHEGYLTVKQYLIPVVSFVWNENNSSDESTAKLIIFCLFLNLKFLKEQFIINKAYRFLNKERKAYFQSLDGLIASIMYLSNLMLIRTINYYSVSCSWYCLWKKSIIYYFIFCVWISKQTLSTKYISAFNGVKIAQPH